MSSWSALGRPAWSPRMQKTHPAHLRIHLLDAPRPKAKPASPGDHCRRLTPSFVAERSAVLLFVLFVRVVLVVVFVLCVFVLVVVFASAVVVFISIFAGH